MFLLLLFVPVVLVFKNFFLPNPLAWGDAPYYYPEGLIGWLSGPYVWSDMGANFGGVNFFLWISPLMYLYGLLGSVFKFGNDLTIRLIFYFPSLILSLIGPYLFARYLKFSKLVAFFSSFVFTLNTYYLLLVDGGQVGVALAYGIFPFTLLFLKRLADSPSKRNFFVGLLTSVLLTAVDPRISIIAFIALLIWLFVEWLGGERKPLKNLPFIVLVGLLIIAINLYWVIPLFKIGGGVMSLEVSKLKLLSLINPLLLFQPHWPGNIYGVISYPPFYFVLLPFFIFAGLLLKNKSKTLLTLLLLFLIFAFLVKGETAPLGGVYSFLVNTIPLGSAFRDSSKFFIPLILFAGILIGSTIENIIKRFKVNNIISFIVLIVCYLYLLFLIAPALSGNLNFVLSDRKHSQDYQMIYQTLKKDEGFYRTVWFPEKYPLAFETSNNPAVEAKTLVNNRPFAVLNASEDVFNFLNNPGFVEWFRVLGIKYLILSGSPRNITPTLKDKENWEEIKDLIGKTPGLEKKDWGISIPVYEVSDTRPKVFAVDKLTAVVGPEPLFSSSLPFAAVYFEDGKFDPRLFEGLNKDSVKILFNGKEELDLTMSFLQRHFAGYSKSGWANYNGADYLKYKYQLLIRGVVFRDFDYGKGISFSTEKGERIEFDLKAEMAGEYILAVRSWGEAIKLDFEGNIVSISPSQKDNFSWYTKQVSLKKGNHKLILENQGGTQIVNVAALVPIAEWNKAQAFSKTYLAHFGTTTENKLSDKWRSVDFEKISPVRYEITAPKDSYWVILADSYHAEWKLKQGELFHDSLPVFSMLNAFYMEPNWTKTDIVFKGQEAFRWGLWFSVVTVLSLTIVYLYFKADKK